MRDAAESPGPLVRLYRWLRRNFGHVYLKDTSVLGNGCQYLFRAKRGRVAFVWHIADGSEIPFVCRLAENGEVQNVHNEAMSGYGKQYGGWRWSYGRFPAGSVKRGGAW